MVTERIEADQDAAIIRDFYADINRNHNSIYHVNVFVEIYGSTRNELAEMEKEVIDILAGVSTTSEHLHLEQREAFSSVQPLGTDHFLADANNMPSLTAAALFPFSSSSCLDTHGMVLGNTEDGGPFIYDLLKRTETLTNSNYFTGGVAGMGKSFLNKKIIKFLRMFGVKIYIFDPEGEYGDLVHQMGGTVINRASGKWKNNIFQVRRFKSADEDDRIGLEYGGETPVYYQHLSWLQEQLSIIHSGLSADNLRALMVMVQDMYKEFDIDADTDFSKLTPLDYPTYTDLYTFIEKHSQKEYKMLTPETMKQLLLHLKSCYDGALSPLFNGHTNIINSDFICFNMKDLLSGSEERSNAVLNNDFAWAWQVMMQKDGYTCICLDEMHLFLRNPYMRKLLQSSVYRARKYNGMIGCCTQRVLQCLNMGYDLKPGQWKYPAWIIRPETKTLFVTADGVVADIKCATAQEKADIRDGKIPTEKFTYFRAAKVYEIGQTTCPAKDYPQILGHGIDDQQHKELYTRLQAVAGMSGFIVSEEPLPSSEFGYCSHDKRIVISDSLGDTQKLATLNHEFAHGLLHLTSDLSPAVEEFEAESVALIMQQRLGLPVEDLTVQYVKNALREAGNLPEFSMEESLGRIVKQANYVCDRLELQRIQQQEVMPVQNQTPVIQAQPNFGLTL